jgi:hypothetical protein
MMSTLPLLSSTVNLSIAQCMFTVFGAVLNVQHINNMNGDYALVSLYAERVTMLGMGTTISMIGRICIVRGHFL